MSGFSLRNSRLLRISPEESVLELMLLVFMSNLMEVVHVELLNVLESKECVFFEKMNRYLSHKGGEVVMLEKIRQY